METPKDDIDEEITSILEMVQEENIQYLNYRFLNILGIPKEILIPIEGLDRSEKEELLSEGVAFDGSSIEGYATIEESDLIMKPDLATFIFVTPRNSKHRTADFICDTFTSHGYPFSGDPRNTLRNAIQEYLDRNSILNVGPELEFFLLKAFEDLDNPQIVFDDREGYFGTNIKFSSQEAKKDIIAICTKMGIPVTTSHHEVAPSQHEIDLKFTDALTMADRIVMVKYLTKTIAQEYGLYATFMPKPKKGICGNGMHLHLSVFDVEGDNLFFEEGTDKYFELSDLALFFIGGLLKYSTDICGILASWVNSYKRLVPGFEAPCYKSWGRENRSVLIRIPAGKGRSKRIELRNPDPAGCSYLQLALILAAGMEGVRKKITPPEPTSLYVFGLSAEERAREGIGCLPNNLFEALEYLKDSNLVEEVLGKHILESFIHIKMEEWDRYRTEVTNWEIKEYLSIL
jgi:glutamine synthetase